MAQLILQVDAEIGEKAIYGWKLNRRRLLANKKGKITQEVEKRLDEIFVEGEGEVSPVEEIEEDAHVGVQESPLRELKSIMLSIEWEISEEVMQRLLDEVARLKKSYNGDRLISPFFKMLDSLGRYIQKYTSRANPEAIKVLGSVYAALEKILVAEGLNQNEKEIILLDQVQRFKDLKREIQGQQPASALLSSAGKEAGELVKGKDVSIDWEEGHLASEAVVAGLNEIKALIRSEFQTLREELQTLVEAKKGSKLKLGRKGKK